MWSKGRDTCALVHWMPVSKDHMNLLTMAYETLFFFFLNAFEFHKWVDQNNHSTREALKAPKERREEIYPLLSNLLQYSMDDKEQGLEVSQ